MAVFLLSLYFYQKLNGHWLTFILLLFTPDLSMVGYLFSPKLGSLTYNSIHTYILAGLLVFAGLSFQNIWLTSFGIILTAHIGNGSILWLWA